MHSITLGDVSSYGVEELHDEAASRVQGGNPFLVAVAAGLVACYVWDVVSDVKGAAQAVADGYHSVAG